LYLAARRYYGSLERAIVEAGVSHLITYEELLTTAACGRRFERLLVKLLKEMGVKFERNFSVDDCKPDFVLKNETWLDAKLSQWTTFSSDTVAKYEPYCKFLTIIFMRGNANLDEMITNKTRLISVHKLIKQLPRHRQYYYINRINFIEEHARGIDSITTKEVSGF
jgi:hypothetical protein